MSPIKLLPQLKFLGGSQILPSMSTGTVKQSRLTSSDCLAIVEPVIRPHTHEPEPETGAVPLWEEQAAPTGSSI